jgi:hypothetical protein
LSRPPRRRDSTGYVRFSTKDAPYGGNEFFARVYFQNVSEHAGSQRLSNQLSIIKHGEHHHCSAQVFLQDFAAGIDSIPAGHPEIGDHDVRTQDGYRPDQLIAIAHGVHDIELGRKQAVQFSHHVQVIVGEQNPIAALFVRWRVRAAICHIHDQI